MLSDDEILFLISNTFNSYFSSDKRKSKKISLTKEYKLMKKIFPDLKMGKKWMKKYTNIKEV